MATDEVDVEDGTMIERNWVTEMVARCAARDAGELVAVEPITADPGTYSRPHRPATAAATCAAALRDRRATCFRPVFQWRQRAPVACSDPCGR